MFKYKLILAYDGTLYGGWQVQNNAVSIQALVEKALSTVLRAPTQIFASGRTDAGVHAKAQVAHFTTQTPIDLYRLCYSLNALLPRDIRALEVVQTDLDFHARYSAISKEYHYHLTFAESPFSRLWAWYIYTPLDLPSMQEASLHLLGTHDFATFANKGTDVETTTRTLFRIELKEEENGLCLEFEGDGFLYKMVRNLTSTLVCVGQKKLNPSDIATLLKAKDRRVAPAVAPAHGLFLMNVNYNIE
jgi:tRNA pseudouridine38-40 synthase